MFNKILVPLDGSKRAEVILPHVEDLARHYKAEVIFLRVVEFEPMALSSDPVYSELDLQDRARRIKEVESYLTAREWAFRETGVKARTQMGDGPVVQEIINCAESENVDLIAMVSHGRTGLARVFYGSVAAGVLHRVDRPLLLIRSLDSV